MSNGEVVCVYTSPNPVIAQLVVGLLANEGIEYMTRGGYHPGYPVTVGLLSEVSIFVSNADVERARALIESAERGEFSLGE